MLIRQNIDTRLNVSGQTGRTNLITLQNLTAANNLGFNTTLIDFKEGRNQTLKTMGSRGRSSKSDKDKTSSSSKRRGSRRSDDSESESESDDSYSRDVSPEARGSGKRKERSSSRRRSRRSSSRNRDSDDGDSYDSDDDRDRSKRKKRSSRNVTEEEINEYMAKKAKKKVSILTFVSLSVFVVLYFVDFEG